MFFNGLENALRYETNLLHKMKREQEQINGGTLHVRSRKGRLFYLEYFGGKERGITKDTNRVYLLARKAFLEEDIKKSEQVVNILKKADAAVNAAEKKSGSNEVLKKFETLDKKRLIYSEEELKWLENQGSQNPYMRENLRFETAAGIMVRSKSERFIADFLYSKSILFQYEPRMQIGEKLMFPDFVLLRPDGTKVIWEHCGLMDDSEYFAKAMGKLSWYRKCGFVQYRNLICTFEDDIRSNDSLEEIVRRFVYG